MPGRSMVSDFIHLFRFHVEVLTPFGNYNNLNTAVTNGNITAGFNACSAPQLSQESVNYREGHFIYTEKFVGIPTVADITLSRGVALTDGTMYMWIKDVVEGNAEYRADVNIYQFHREAKNPTDFTSINTQMKPDLSLGGFALYSCTNAFPTEYKTSGDMDASSSEVAIQSLTMSIEAFNLQLVPYTGPVQLLP